MWGPARKSQHHPTTHTGRSSQVQGKNNGPNSGVLMQGRRNVASRGGEGRGGKRTFNHNMGKTEITVTFYLASEKSIGLQHTLHQPTTDRIKQSLQWAASRPTKSGGGRQGETTLAPPSNFRDGAAASPMPPVPVALY